MKTPNICKKRIVLAFMIFSVILFLLCIRTGYIQIVKANEYSKMAAQQQSKDEILTPERGTIYDRNNNELAINLEAYSVWVRPGEVKQGKTEKEKEESVKEFCDTLAPLIGEDASKLNETISNTEKTLIKIKSSVDKETAEKIREEKFVGLSLNEEVDRYYPMGDFLSHVLGGVTADNQGLSGLELEYDNELSGVKGRWLKDTDNKGNPLFYGKDEYNAPEDGENIVLTIDQVIQNYTEKSVKEALEKNDAKRVSCIVMDTKTGEILSMASAPSFDPNNPRVPLDEEEKEEFEKMDSQQQMDYLNNMWRNPLISNVYEPGSTAKLITTAAALEEGITTKEEQFYCEGHYVIDGIKVNCWSYDDPHKDENLYESVRNSCNPVFMQLALRLGKDKYYNYIESFGLTEKTNVDFPGESNPIILNEDNARSVDLGIMGFGQTNAVTPIQLVTAVSALGNDGKLMEPHIVKEITDNNGKTVEKIEPKVVRQAISEETADEMCEIMDFVVNGDTGSRAKLPGYKVGGKTGTSEVASEEGGYTSDVIASFIGMVPMEDPQFTILYIIDSPAAGSQGGEVAAPAARDLLEKILKYKDIEPNYEGEEQETVKKETTTVPDITNKKIGEAKEILENANLKYIISPTPEDDSEFTVKSQYPLPGESIVKNGIVYIYRE